MRDRCILCGERLDPRDDCRVLSLTEGPQQGSAVHYRCAAMVGTYYRIEPDGSHTAIDMAWLDAHPAAYAPSPAAGR